MGSEVKDDVEPETPAAVRAAPAEGGLEPAGEGAVTALVGPACAFAPAPLSPAGRAEAAEAVASTVTASDFDAGAAASAAGPAASVVVAAPFALGALASAAAGS